MSTSVTIGPTGSEQHTDEIAIDFIPFDKKDQETNIPQELAAVKNASDFGICWFNHPVEKLGLEYILSVKGAENFHVYLWLIKDLAWTQSWYYIGYAFGCAAVIWSVILLAQAAMERNTNEVCISMGQVCW